jgi:peptidoglycan/LPS O-acetylase OafA/YrhL
MGENQVLQKDSNKLLSIQALRGLAAVLVVYTHAIVHQKLLGIGDSVQQNFYFLQDFGAVGVDIFFVISGFIITIVSPKFIREFGVQDFLVKRFIRIAPIYWLLTLVELLNSLIQHPDRVNTASVIKSITFLPFFDKESFVLPVLNLGWTLSFEVYFYTIVGLFLLTKRKNFIVYAIAFIFTLICIGSFSEEVASPFFKFITNPMSLEFVLGCLIGLIYQADIRPRPIVSSGLIILALLSLGSTLILGYGDISPAGNILNGNAASTRVLLWGIPSAALVAGMLFAESNNSLKPQKYTVLFGDASYSIYLTHYFSLTIFDKIWRSFHLEAPDVFIVFAVTFSILSGVGFYLLVEKNLLHYFNLKYSAYCKRRDLVKAANS